MFAPVRPAPGQKPIRINLLSDTQTKPSEAMRAAMAAAEVGDEQVGDDPTVNVLCDRMAALLGKEAAMFLPSGTMCNQVAMLTHCRPGDEVIAHHLAHIITAEGGGASALSGVSILGLAGERGLFDGPTLTAALRSVSRYAPPQTLLAVEQTANLGGGAVWPVAQLDAVAEIARTRGMATHMDGARLMNAVVVSGQPAIDHARLYDSVWLDFTKGLGAPIGAVLAGSAAFIDAAWRWKQRLGGALRQAGIAAAGCLYALDHNIDRLAEDHANARVLARGLAQLPELTVETPETNLVFFAPVPGGMDAAAIAAAALARGLRLSVMGSRLRACTHLDVSAAQIAEATEIIAAILRQ